MGLLQVLSQYEEGAKWPINPVKWNAYAQIKYVPELSKYLTSHGWDNNWQM